MWSIGNELVKKQMKKTLSIFIKTKNYRYKDFSFIYKYILNAYSNRTSFKIRFLVVFMNHNKNLAII